MVSRTLRCASRVSEGLGAGRNGDGGVYVYSWPTLCGPDGSPRGEPVYKMAEGLAVVPEGDVDAAIEAAEECPGECIFLEVD
mgnify:CR=1 FL=1